MARLIYFMPTSLDGYVEDHLLVVPIMLGGGKRVLPSAVSVKLDLLDERRFANGMVYLRYQARG